MKVFLVCLSIVFCAALGQYATSVANAQDVAVDRKKATVVSCGGVCKMPSRRSGLLAAGKIVQTGTEKHSEEMVWLPGGTFSMGSKDFPDALPVHTVTVDGFYMDEHEVTNAQFEKFVQATGYKTIAEQPLKAEDFPGVPADKLVAGSAVFTPPNHRVSLNDPSQWWSYVAGANWKHPQGRESSIKGKENEPVVQISYPDAAAYAKWAGKRLPTEAEWEFAARGGKTNTNYYWGNELKPNNKWSANIFQGSFPEGNTDEDGYKTLSPVKSFPPNAFGLYDMEGNAWEWCQDFYRPGYNSSSNTNPKGPKDSYDPEEPGTIKRVQRGGSFLCSDEYCNRYKAGSRGKGEISSASNNLGFRCVREK